MQSAVSSAWWATAGTSTPSSPTPSPAPIPNPNITLIRYAADMIEDEWRLVDHSDTNPNPNPTPPPTPTPDPNPNPHQVDHSDTWLDEIGAAELRPAPGYP